MHARAYWVFIWFSLGGSCSCFVHAVLIVKNWKIVLMQIIEKSQLLVTLSSQWKNIELCFLDRISACGTVQ